MIEAPIFHVNGDDPEAVVFCAKVATEFRQKFQKPVVIDMFCYAASATTKATKPSFTQPLMYKKIRSMPTTLEIYGKKLTAERRRFGRRGRPDEGGLGARISKPNSNRARATSRTRRLARRQVVGDQAARTTSTIRAAATPGCDRDAERDR